MSLMTNQCRVLVEVSNNIDELLTFLLILLVLASIPTAPEPQQQMVVFSPQQVQHQGSNTAETSASSGTHGHPHPTQNRALNPNYDHLPAELVQVLVNQQSEQQQQMLPPPPPPPVQQQARHHNHHQQQSQSRNVSSRNHPQDTDWINAYRHRQQ